MISIETPIAISRQYEQTERLHKRNDAHKLQGRTILLVEDNKLNSMVASIMLNKVGLHVVCVENGAEAVHAMQTFSYDLILMDIEMPVMDGIPATKIIRKSISSLTPIIALTARDMIEDKEAYLTAGMNDFLTKPFQENELINLLCRFF